MQPIPPQPLIGFHKVTEGHGESCQFCHKPQTTYLSIERPTRIVICLACAKNFINLALPQDIKDKLEGIKDNFMGLSGTVGNIASNIYKLFIPKVAEPEQPIKPQKKSREKRT